MVSGEFKNLKKLGKIVESIRNTGGGSQEYQGIYAVMFVSFDIVNSSVYKTKYKANWATVLREIMRHTISAFETIPSGGYDFWKALGDEVIYTRKIYTLQEVAYTLDDIYSKVQYLNKMIEDAVICDKNASEILGIKATAWICDISSVCEYSGNVYNEFEIKDNRRQSDFSGADIDAGFRISKYSMKNRLVISCKLAYVLLKSEALGHTCKRVKLLTYKPLKGVWNDAPYPIVLYHGDATVDFDTSIIGCDSPEEEILQEYLERVEKHPAATDGQYSTYEQEALTNLCQSMGLTGQYEEFIQLIANQTSAYKRKTRPLKRAHCRVVCYGVDAEKTPFFLLIKPAAQAELGLTEFNFYLRSGTTFVLDMQDFFEDAYGLKVSIQKDKRRHMDIPLAVDFYAYDDGGVVLPGEVLLGKIEGGIPAENGAYQFKVVPLDDMASLKGCDPTVEAYLNTCVEVMDKHNLI